MEGLHKRFKTQVPPEYSERIGMELELIKTMGFSNYFLIVSDFVRFAKEKGILVGPEGVRRRIAHFLLSPDHGYRSPEI